MSETLVIRLHDATVGSWVQIDGDGARIGPVGHGALSEATAAAEGRRVVLLVPGVDVTLAEPELPVRGGNKLLQAVPFVLEEQLACDVEALHFALGARSADGTRATVAAVARAELDGWLAACAAAGLQPVAAYSDAMAVPGSPNGVSLLLDGARLYVNRGGRLPYVLDAAPLALALELALQRDTEGADDDSIAASTAASSAASGVAAPADAPPGEHLTFYLAPADYEREREAIEGLRETTASLQVKLLPDGPTPLLATQAVAAAPLCLLQGAYAASTGLATRLQRWRLPAALAATALLAFVVNQGVGLWQLRKAERALDARITELFQQVLPGQPVVDVRAQMQGALNASRGAGNGLLATLTQLSQAMAQAPNGRVEAISYRGDGLDLRMTAPTVEAIDGIKQRMSQGGLAVELQSATPRGSLVEGRLQVRWGSA